MHNKSGNTESAEHTEKPKKQFFTLCALRSLWFNFFLQLKRWVQAHHPTPVFRCFRRFVVVQILICVGGLGLCNSSAPGWGTFGISGTVKSLIGRGCRTAHCFQVLG